MAQTKCLYIKIERTHIIMHGKKNHKMITEGT